MIRDVDPCPLHIRELRLLDLIDRELARDDPELDVLMICGPPPRGSWWLPALLGVWSTLAVALSVGLLIAQRPIAAVAVLGAAGVAVVVAGVAILVDRRREARSRR